MSPLRERPIHDLEIRASPMEYCKEDQRMPVSLKIGGNYLYFVVIKKEEQSTRSDK